MVEQPSISVLESFLVKNNEFKVPFLRDKKCHKIFQFHKWPQVMKSMLVNEEKKCIYEKRVSPTITTTTTISTT